MASINFGCPQCQTRHEVDASRAGTTFRCTNCYFQCVVPEKSTLRAEELQDFYAEMADGTRARHAAVVAVCPVCHTTIPGYEEEIGMRKECPECGTQVEIRESDRKRLGLKDGIHTMSAAGTDPENIYDLNEIVPPPLPGAYENNFRKTHSGRIPVVCSLCRTLIHAVPEQLGTEITCPDCGRPVLVEMMEEKENRELTQRLAALGTYGVDENATGGDDAGNAAATDAENAAQNCREEEKERHFSQPCKLCGTLLDAVSADIGRELMCPDCETKNFILPPVRKQDHARGAVSRAHEKAAVYTLGTLGAVAQDVAVKQEPQLKLKCILCGELQRIPEKDLEKLCARQIMCVECGRPLNRTCILNPWKTPLVEEAGPDLVLGEARKPDDTSQKKILQNAFLEIFGKRPDRPLREQLDEYGVNAPALLGEEPVRREVLTWSMAKFFTVGVLDVLAQGRVLLAGCMLTAALFGLSLLLPLVVNNIKTELMQESAYPYYAGVLGLTILGPPVLMFGALLFFRILLRSASGIDPVVSTWKQLTALQIDHLMILIVLFLAYACLPGYLAYALLAFFAAPPFLMLTGVLLGAIFIFPQALRSVLVNGFSADWPEDNELLRFLSPAKYVLVVTVRLLAHYLLVGTPFDGKIWRDLRLFPARWAIFYVLSFLIAGVAAATLISGNFLTLWAIFLNVFLMVLYFRMLGRVWFYSDEMRRQAEAEAGGDGDADA